MTRNYQAQLVGVIGDPVTENPTVAIMESSFKEKNLFFRYLTICVKEHQLEDAIKGMRAFNMRGLNITMPYKISVVKYLDELTKAASIIGAVNTIVNENGKLIGENTDGKGFTAALKNAGFDCMNKKAVILGAGGAARAIAVELALLGLAEIVIINRDEQRGLSLAEAINANTHTRAVYEKWQGTAALPSDANLIVNGTSIGMQDASKPDIDYSAINKNMYVGDVVYFPTTPFLDTAKSAGACVVSGLDMLVLQGTIAFKLWTGVDAPVEVMDKSLKAEFGF